MRLFKTKNRKVFAHYFEKAVIFEDKNKISFATVLLDLEYVFVFQKLFEMHVFDYIVDRQDPENKTEDDTNQLVDVCKEYTDDLFKNLIFKQYLDVHNFKKSFGQFKAPYIESRGNSE